MENDKTFNDYKIEKESTLHMVVDYSKPLSNISAKCINKSLLYQCVSGNLRDVKELVNKGANVRTGEEPNKISCFTLSMKNIQKDYEIMKYLVLEKNLDPNQKIFDRFGNYKYNYFYSLDSINKVNIVFHLLMLKADPYLNCTNVNNFNLFLIF